MMIGWAYLLGAIMTIDALLLGLLALQHFVLEAVVEGFQEAAEAGHEAVFELRGHEFAVEGLFGGAVGEDFLFGGGFAEEDAHDLVVALAGHPGVDAFVGDVEGAEVFDPGAGVGGVGVDEDPVHVKDYGCQEWA